MRQTILTRAEARLTLETDDYGTRATAADGHVIEEHGTDRHAEALERLHAEGWAVTAEQTLRPEVAAPSDGGTPGIADAPGPTGTVTDGQAS